MEQYKKRLFCVFLLINSLCWSFIQFLRTTISIDSMEAISWGELIDFGTNKHPPFSGWLISGFYNIFAQHDFVAYFLGQLCIVVGFVYVYKLAKFFLEEEKAMCASLILSSCYYYTYISFIDNFNCNFVSMALFPIITYYFYKSMKENKISDWIILGITSGLGVLTKYQIIFLFFALFLYLLICERKQFRQKGLYISIVVGLFTILPHLVWLYKTDFFSLIYMVERTEIGTHNTPSFLLPFGRIVFPLKFLFDQILSVATCIITYLLLIRQTNNVQINKDWKNPKYIYILFITLIPLLTQSFISAIENNRIMGIWGSIMVGYFGIFLFYFFPIKFNKSTFNYFIKLCYTFMILWLIGIFIFSRLQLKRTISYPYKKIMPEFNRIWNKKTNDSEFKYVYGHIDYVYQFHVYNDKHPKAIPETFGHKNPWITTDEMKKSGVLIVGKSKKNVRYYMKELEIPSSANYTSIPEKYEFEVKNILGKTKKYKFYYVIIPPQKY